MPKMAATGNSDPKNSNPPPDAPGGENSPMQWNVNEPPSGPATTTRKPPVYQPLLVTLDRTGDQSPNAWQVINHPNKNSNKRRKRVSIESGESLQQSLSTTNRFTPLRETENAKTSDETAGRNTNETINRNENNTDNAKSLKPPPIFVPDVQIMQKLSDELQNFIDENDYTYETTNRDGQIKIMPKTAIAYRKIIQVLKKEQAEYHTYQLKEECAYRVMIRSLHPSVPLEDIKTELNEVGHKVRNVANIFRRGTKVPLPLFFVDLERNTNNKEIYKLDVLLNARIYVEPLRKQNNPVQCIRCQRHGHTNSPKTNYNLNRQP